MITLTSSEAVDIMNAQILETIQDGRALALLGYVPVIRWQGPEIAGKPNSEQYWLRVSHQLDIVNVQANLSNCEGLPGQKRYRSTGLTYIQIFGPTDDKSVADTALKLATICRSAFRGQLTHAGDDAIWFRNAKINNLPLENDLYRLNVIAEHEYDELA